MAAPVPDARPDCGIGARYGVSRITVRSALAGLGEAGYIEPKHGKGSLVLPRPHTLSSGLSQLCSAVALDSGIADALDVAPGHPAMFMEELTCDNDGRIVNRSQAWMLNEYFHFTLRRRR